MRSCCAQAALHGEVPDYVILDLQVEFQNKFYHGDGVQFKPFTFSASDLEL